MLFFIWAVLPLTEKTLPEVSQLLEIGVGVGVGVGVDGAVAVGGGVAVDGGVGTGSVEPPPQAETTRQAEPIVFRIIVRLRNTEEACINTPEMG